jgi:hypothetical protein
VSARLRAIASQTVTIAEGGRYRSPGGREVDLASEITAAVQGTRLYAPRDQVVVPAPGSAVPAIEVTGETSLQAARRLGGRAACLVFASAKNPGAVSVPAPRRRRRASPARPRCTRAGNRCRSSTPSTGSSTIPPMPG